MTRALLIKPDNTTERVDITDWKQISEHLDCRIFTIVPNMKDAPFDLLGDDEGALVAPEFLEQNMFATAYYGGHPIFGRVLAMGPVDDEGEATDLPDSHIEAIERTVPLMLVEL